MSGDGGDLVTCNTAPLTATSQTTWMLLWGREELTWTWHKGRCCLWLSLSDLVLWTKTGPASTIAFLWSINTPADSVLIPLVQITENWKIFALDLFDKAAFHVFIIYIIIHYICHRGIIIISPASLLGPPHSEHKHWNQCDWTWTLDWVCLALACSSRTLAY